MKVFTKNGVLITPFKLNFTVFWLSKYFKKSLKNAHCIYRVFHKKNERFYVMNHEYDKKYYNIYSAHASNYLVFYYIINYSV